jgi:RNA polymerase sigma-70 factor (ECF subfamily)
MVPSPTSPTTPPGGPAEPPADAASLPDGELLTRYLAGREPAALEALVRRHGPVVLGVCRRVLGDPHDAEDAFQATFLVLVRKAGAVRPREMVGPWLYGVATRTALKARALGAKRRAREKQVDALPEVAAADWLPLLDREVQRLPAKYRLPVVLCELQGHSRADAAGLLRVPEGTLSSRLARARVLLRRRLVRCGAGAAAVLGAALFPQEAAASVPAALVQSTVQAAGAFAAGAAAGAATPPALLAKGVLTSMHMTRLAVAAVLVAVGGVAGLLYLVAAPPGGGDGRSDKDKLQGTWGVVAATIRGVDDGPEIEAMKKDFELDFRGDKVTIKLEADYKLDPTTSPKQIDLFPSYGPAKEQNQVIHGIYELTGDELKLCISGPGEERPTKFASEKGSKVMLLMLKRKAAN